MRIDLEASEILVLETVVHDDVGNLKSQTYK